jgi:hypothetical protein
MAGADAMNPGLTPAERIEPPRVRHPQKPVFMSPRWWASAVVTPARCAWAAGGIWERFFLVVPAIGLVYFVGIGLWIIVTSQPPEVAYPFLIVAVSFVGLQEALMTPILSGPVIRALLDLDQFRSPRNARTLAEYLESESADARWLRGDIMSLVWLIVYLSWGGVALFFSRLTGLRDGVTFLIAHAVFFVSLFASYHLVLGRFLARGVAKGFPLRRLTGESL